MWPHSPASRLPPGGYQRQAPRTNGFRPDHCRPTNSGAAEARTMEAAPACRKRRLANTKLSDSKSGQSVSAREFCDAYANKKVDRAYHESRTTAFCERLHELVAVPAHLKHLNLALRHSYSSSSSTSSRLNRLKWRQSCTASKGGGGRKRRADASKTAPWRPINLQAKTQLIIHLFILMLIFTLFNQMFTLSLAISSSSSLSLHPSLADNNATNQDFVGAWPWSQASAVSVARLVRPRAIAELAKVSPTLQQQQNTLSNSSQKDAFADEDAQEELKRHNRISHLHKQLTQLKMELENELKPRQAHQPTQLSKTAGDETLGIERRHQFGRLRPTPIVLGAPCLSSAYCNQAIKHSHCDLQSFTCACLREHVQANTTTCLPPALLGYDCQLNEQCRMRVPDGVCELGKCSCPRGKFVSYRKNKCLPASKIDDYCLLDAQCQLNDKHSFCKWKIQNVYGTCKCPPNYKLLPSRLGTNGSAPLEDERRLSCIPRLGDVCLSDEECLEATKNSLCSNLASMSQSTKLELASNDLATVGVSFGSERLQTGRLAWPSSSAAKSRCTCKPGFKWSANELECVPSQTESAATVVSGNAMAQSALSPSKSTPSSGSAYNQQQDSHKYEMIVIAQDKAGGDAQIRPPSAVPPEELEIKMIPLNTASGGQSSSQPARTMPKSTTTTTTTTSTTTTTTTTTTTSAPTAAPRSTTATAASPATVAITLPPDEHLGRRATGSNFANATTTTTAAPEPYLRMSSLGKPCESRAQCQLRDPFSDCINGLCECMAPSERCRAKSTGCHKDTFQCRNGQCISWYFVCDQFKNCADGSDEDECTTGACPSEAFQCASDGACLSRGKVCNGHRECSDGSDELECDKRDRLQAALANGSSAARPVAVQARGCPNGAFACASGQCLPAYVFCNAVEDCADGSDEDELICERPAHLGGRVVAAAAEPSGLQAAAQQQQPPSPGRPKSPLAADEPQRKWASTLQSASAGAGQAEPAGPKLSKLTASNQTAGESPLIRTDRASIERLLAALAQGTSSSAGAGGSSGHWRMPERIGRPAKGPSRAGAKRRSKLLSGGSADGGAGEMSTLVTGAKAAGAALECPRWAFTCANGKCRSNAILCSGVDGCGDNSDEDQCEVCQCEPPLEEQHLRFSGAKQRWRAGKAGVL